jgi:hypothetical protein
MGADGDGNDEKDKVIADLQRDLGLMRQRATTAEGALKTAEATQAKEFERGKAEGAAEATSTLKTEHARAIAAAEVRAHAARVLADPDDAPKFLDMSKVLDAAGNVDPAAIRTQLNELVEKKPYLKAPEPGAGAPGEGTPPGSPPGTPPGSPPGSPPGNKGDGDGGPRGALARTDGDARMNDTLRQALSR